MPPKKHTRSESNANQASSSNDKRQKPNEEEGWETESEGSGDLVNIEPIESTVLALCK